MRRQVKDNKSNRGASGTMDNDLVMYIRSHPQWYIILSRDPQRVKELQDYYKQDTNRTFNARLEQLSTILNMVELLL